MMGVTNQLDKPAKRQQNHPTQSPRHAGAEGLRLAPALGVLQTLPHPVSALHSQIMI